MAWVKRAASAGLLALASGCSSDRFADAERSSPEVVPARAVLETARAVARADPALAKRLTASSPGWTAQKDGIVSPGWEARPGKKTAELAARAPERADGKWELTLDRTEHYRLGLEWEGVARVAAEPAEGALVYRDLYPATDAIVVSTGDYVEVTYVLRDSSAPRKWSWKLETGPGIGGAKSAPDGGLYVVRNDGEPVWNVPAAYAVDASGKGIGVRSRWVDRGIEFEMEDEPKQYPVVVDPIVTALFWVQRTPATSPTARADPAMAYDSQRGKTVLFGGGNPPLAETWEWDGTTWTRLTPALSPPGTNGHVMAYDSQRQRTVLLHSSQTWEWDGTNWTLRTPATTPIASGVMAYDSQRGRSVLLQGDVTWEWDGINWVLRTPTVKPTARVQHAMAYDSQRGRTVVFGGNSSATLNPIADTWEWDGAIWTSRTPTTSPPATVSHAIAYDSQRGMVTVFGGYQQPGAAFSSDTWEWNGTDWALRVVTAHPPGRQSHAMAHDSRRGRTVLFGGHGYAGFLADTWELLMLRAGGSDCTSGTQCGSGFCSDGVCCDSACEGSCNVCTASLGASANGTCTVVPTGSPGSPACGSPIQCNGSSGSCPTPCSSGLDCVSTHYCRVSNGQCLQKLVTGAACPEGNQSCQSGHCLSGACSTCSDETQCSSADYCSAAAHGCAPRSPVGSACPEGHEACQSRYCASSTCACRINADCAASDYCQVATGRCVSKLPNGTPCPAGNPSCQTGYCHNGVCSSCLDDTNCAAGSFCNASGQCLPQLALGTPCPEGGHSCASGFCTDRVCCDQGCAGVCQACTGALKGFGLDGACEDVAAGRDPDDDCTADPDYPNSCKADGNCDGRGACRPYAVEGTLCAPQRCDGNELTTAACNNAGNCLARTNSCPGNLACVSNSECAGSCSDDADCAAGFACTPGGACATSGSTCRDDRTVLDSHGAPSSCAPYRCSGGACKTTCASVDDCVESAVCDDTRHCIAPSASSGSEDGCACRAGSTSRRSPAGAFALGILAILAGVRRQRRFRRSPGTRAPLESAGTMNPLTPSAVIALGALLVSCGNEGAPSAQGAEKGDAGANTSIEDRGDSAQHVLDLARIIARADSALARRLAPTARGWTAHEDGIVSPGWERRPGKTTAELAARAPERADGKWELTLDRTEHYRLALQWEGAAAANAEPADGALVFRNVHEQTDAIVTSTSSYVEVSYVLRDESAPRKWIWQFDGGPGISGARSAPDGGLYVVRNDGEPVWNVPAAYAVDAAGNRIGVRSHWVDRRIEFEMEGAPAAYPVVVDPIVTALFWLQRTPVTSPSPRYRHATAFDSVRARSILFGGMRSSVGASLGDLWEWDGTNWAARTPAMSPTGRLRHAMAYDSVRRRTLLFGGDSGEVDTWEWDGTTWSQRTPATSPPPRIDVAMAYDSVRGRIVLFGGYTGAFLADTWEWDGTTWSQRTPATSPPARTNHAMAYDPARGRTVLFGGFTGGFLADTWEWDGTSWAQRLPAESPPARVDHAMAHDSIRGRTVLFGGQGSDGLSRADTWEWDGTNWRESSPTTSPPARLDHAMAHDSVRGRTLLFGGSDYGDTWELAFLRTSGSDCGSDTQCGSGICVDGVCCDKPCGGACEACKASLGASSDGTCTILSSGSPGSPTCAAPFRCNGTSETCPTSCSADDHCVASHYCRDSTRYCVVKLGQGAPCPDGNRSCQSGFCLNGTCSICQSDAHCSASQYCSSTAHACTTRLPVGSPCPEGDRACQSGICLSGECSTCANDTQCSSANYCSAAANACIPRLAIGAACLEGDHSCQSGYCSNGTCACQSDTHCAASEYCQVTSGRCLSKLPNGTPCPDGNPSCQTGFCNGGACSACLNDGSCSAGSFCSTSGQCQTKLPVGTPCPEGGHSCVQAYCVDGVCCDSWCNGVCEACTASLKGSGTDGACGAILAGTDPAGECTADPDYPESCKADGMCDGAGACRLYAILNTVCSSPSCSGSELTTAACNSAGSCLARTNSCFGNLVCASAQECAANCTTDADCVAGFSCGSDRHCTPTVSGSTCKDERTVLDSHGLPSSCVPYRCSGGACKTGCTSVDDCVAPNVCSDEGRCVATGSESGDAGGCACRSGSSSHESRLSASLAILAALLSVQRRRGRRRASMLRASFSLEGPGK